MDDDDPNILLAIQLSLQDAAMAEIESNHDVLANEASLGAIGTSLPSRLEQSAPGVLSRASLSSSELLELGDNLARLGNINISSQYSAATGVSASVQHCDSHHRAYGAPGGSDSSTGLFSSSSDTLDSTTCGSHDPSTSSALGANANLLGNIMAWFHDMNPQGITLVPSTSSDTDLGALHAGGEGCLHDDEKDGGVLHESRKPQEGTAEVGFFSQRLSDVGEKECAVAQRPTQLDLVGLDSMPLPYMATLGTSGDPAERGGSKVCRVDTPQCDSVSDQLASTSSSEWEDQVHLV